MIIAQITDLHITEGKAVAGVDSAATLERMIDHLNGLDPRPDLVLATGDLVNLGTTAEYERLRARLDRLAMPYYVIPGNHDAREPLRAAFADHGYLPAQGFLQYELEAGELRLIGLDSFKTPNANGGELCTERLAWLEQRLERQPDRPTVIFLHHPPFLTGIAPFDADPLIGAGELAALVRRHPCIERILCGHLHRPVTRLWAGTTVCVPPSTSFQIALDLRPGKPFALAPLDPAGYLLHLWLPGNGLVTHLGTLPATESTMR